MDPIESDPFSWSEDKEPALKRPKLFERHTLPKDLLEHLPHWLHVRTDEERIKRNFTIMKRRWLLEDRKDYFARWNLDWPTDEQLKLEREWRKNSRSYRIADSEVEDDDSSVGDSEGEIEESYESDEEYEEEGEE